MDLLQHLSLGVHVALTPANFLYCLIGATLGTLVGVLPGLGPVTTIAMLLPITFKIPAVVVADHALRHLLRRAPCRIDHRDHAEHARRADLGGDLPGRQSDGAPGPRRRWRCASRRWPRSSPAAPARWSSRCFPRRWRASALVFGPPEYTAIIVMALVTIAVLSSSSLLLTLGAAVLGLLLGTVGTDVNSGIIRFSFGEPRRGRRRQLRGGRGRAVRLRRGDHPHDRRAAPAQADRPRIAGLLPTRQDLAASWKPILRGTAIGAGFGILPGTGPLISSFASYVHGDASSPRDPTRFGNGAIEGVAGPEAANNAAALTHFIPMLTLGIPAGAANGADARRADHPGHHARPAADRPQHADLFWGVVASMWIGNLMLLVLNLPLVGIWVRLLAIPYRVLYPAVLVFCCIGVYSVSNSTFDVFLAAGFGVIGFVLQAARLLARAADARPGAGAACWRRTCAAPCCCRAATCWCSSSSRSAFAS